MNEKNSKSQITISSFFKEDSYQKTTTPLYGEKKAIISKFIFGILITNYHKNQTRNYKKEYLTRDETVLKFETIRKNVGFSISLNYISTIFKELCKLNIIERVQFSNKSKNWKIILTKKAKNILLLKNLTDCQRKEKIKNFIVFIKKFLRIMRKKPEKVVFIDNRKIKDDGPPKDIALRELPWDIDLDELLEW